MKNRVNIGIIGGGVTGLVAAYELAKKGFKVTLFEKDEQLGGLASTFPIGDTHLEKFYHHYFTSDKYAHDLIAELGLKKNLVYTKPLSAVYTNRLVKYSNIIDFCHYPQNELVKNILSNAKLSTLFLKSWRHVSDQTAAGFLQSNLSPSCYKEIWQPLLENKFGSHADKISLSWFQSRLKSRSSKLGYIDGSNKKIIDTLASSILTYGGQICLNSPIKNFSRADKYFRLCSNGKVYTFSHIILAASPFAIKTPTKNSQRPYLSTFSLVCVLKNPISPYYWINLNSKKTPFLAMIEHTNMVSSQKYYNRHIVYLGLYADNNSEIMHCKPEYYENSAIELFKDINRKFDTNWFDGIYQFKAADAQHIADTQYYKNLPSLKISNNLYHGSLGHIYPHDRGVDKAIWLGKELAQCLIKDHNCSGNPKLL